MNTRPTDFEMTENLFVAGQPPAVNARHPFQKEAVALAAGYDAVSGRPGAGSSVPVETGKEDTILPLRQRNRLVSKHRSLARNTTFAPGTRQQITSNVIGTLGGKLTLTTKNENFDRCAGDWFSGWSRHAEFTNALHLNELLKLVLAQLTHIGGDCVLMFDDGILTGKNGCGKIRMFESDEIANIDQNIFDARHGKHGYTQSNGLIYDRYGRHIGCFVSSTLRGKIKFDEGMYFTLLRDLSEEEVSCNWNFVHQFWRPNQGRGIPTMAYISSTIQEIAELLGTEIQASKLNAALTVKVFKDANASATLSDNRGYKSALDDEVKEDDIESGDFPKTKDSEGNLSYPPTDFTELNNQQAHIVNMMPGSNMELFDTKRPNLNTAKFIEILKGDAATVFGLNLLFTTLNPETSYTAFRGAMILAYQAFDELKKKMERGVCDWVGYQALRWAGEQNLFGIAFERFPVGWDRKMSWAWPKMPEVNAVDAQVALAKRFENAMTTLRDELGDDYFEQIKQVSKEVQELNSVGLLHPIQRANVGGGVAKAEPATNDGGKK